MKMVDTHEHENDAKSQRFSFAFAFVVQVHSHFYRSLRNDKKISRQQNLHFQNFIVVTFPTKNSVLDDFPLCPKGRPPPSKPQILFLLSSRRL